MTRRTETDETSDDPTTALAVTAIRPTDRDRDQVRAAHHKHYAVTGSDDGEVGEIEVLCRQPSRAEWKRFMSISFGDKSKAHDAMVTLFTQCLAWPRHKSPERADLDALFERAPQVETMVAGAFVGELQNGFDAAAKKA